VPGAERRQLAYLDDLTTAGTVGSGHTNPADYAGLTHAALSAPSGVPGIQNHPELYTRGVDLEGTLWTVNGPNLHVPATGNQGL